MLRTWCHVAALVLALKIYRMRATVLLLPTAQVIKIEATLNTHRRRLRRYKRAAADASQVRLDVHEEVPIIHTAAYFTSSIHAAALWRRRGRG